MEEKIIKQIKTQCPFPLLIYKTRIKYNEVRKASGIAYILLELITKQRSDMRFREALLKFGIPAELHSLFGSELAGLVNNEIVQANYPASHFANPKYFGEIQVNDVTLTVKGQKLFREGAIPTGQEKERPKDIYFSPVTRKFEVQYNMPYSPISGSFLGEEFLDKVDIDISGLEDYINANPTKLGLKAEERMISFATDEPQKMNVRKEDNITLNIYPSFIEFMFADSAERAFFDKYYSSSIMTNGMTMKDKFKFPKLNGNLLSVNITDIRNLTALYLPNELTKQAGRQCVIFLHRGNAGLERDDVICADKRFACELLDKIDKNAQFALLDKSGCKIFCAVNVVMPCKNFGDVLTLPLLTESNASLETFRGIVDCLYNEYAEKPFDDDVGKVVSYAVESLGNTEYFGKIIKKKLQSVVRVDERIEILLKLNSAFKKYPSWKNDFTEAAIGLYNESVSEVKIENIIYKNTVLTPLKGALQISNSEYVRKFSENICKTESKEIVYEALDSAGFTDMETLSVANVIETFMSNVLAREVIASETVLASKYKTVHTNLWKLCDMLGIENSAEYTLREDYNTDDFFNAYATLQNVIKAVEKYRPFAPKEYELLGRYLEIFEPIHELLSIECTASANPEKITKKYIDDYITRGKYKDAICDLLVKLQYDLRKLLQADRETQANELIDMALNEKLISKPQVDVLHKLRMCRNGFQHPERKQIPFDKPTIENWRDIVFMLGGKNES
ncbi:MAG: hypothetical protein K2K80_05975 [Clostridia bacterium]|nr:hypothetical protein [Clostridia bacterium]